MKIESIKEPRQLDDGTVKASITVSDEDFIPLIQLIKDVKKGAEIDIDVRKSDDVIIDPYFDLASTITRDLAERLRDAHDRGVEEGLHMHDFPATLVERFDKQIEDGKPFTGNLENSCGTNK